MKIALINPPSPDGEIYIRDVNRSGRLSREGTIWPQTSLAMIAGVLEPHDVRIWDCIATRKDYRTFYSELKDFAPDWVVIESVSSTIPHDLIVAHYAKYLKAKTVLISPHGEALAEETKLRFPSIDHIIHYDKYEEPEYAIREVITGVARKPEETFETLPYARQDLLPLQCYNIPLIGPGYTFVITSRGCPWKCIYCRQTVTWKSRVRYRSADQIVGEIRTHNLRNVAFHADTATVNKPRMYEICEKMPKGTRWICNSRVDTVDLPLLKAMKKAGCWMVLYGCESGDNEVLRLNKKEANVEQARQAVLWAKEAGLKVWGYFMLGLYGDTPESMERTIALSKELPFDLVNYSIAAPYPGTEWGKISTENGWLTSSNWEDFDQNYSAIVDQPNCPHQTVIDYQRKAYKAWYFSPRGIRFFAQAWKPRYTRFFWTVASNHIRI